VSPSRGIPIVAVHERNVAREGVDVLEQLAECQPATEVEILVANEDVAAGRRASARKGVSSAGPRWTEVTS
jgi:hypothetical protein